MKIMYGNCALRKKYGRDISGSEHNLSSSENKA